MKTVFRISFCLLLSLNIVFGYSGVTIFKMVCASENGKTLTSMIDVSNECEHSKPAEDDCCKPSYKKESTTQKKSCCDYSHSHLKLDDETLVQQQQNSANHYLQALIFFNHFNWLLPHLIGKDEPAIENPPPLLTLRKQSFQSFIQTYLI